MKIWKISQQDQEFSTLEEFLEWETYINKDVLKSIVSKNKLLGKDFGFVTKIEENGKDFWLLYDSIDNSYSKIDIKEWVSSVDVDEILKLLGLTDNNLYIGEIGYFSEIKQNPGKVYHYTTEESWKKIQDIGYLRGNSGSGLSNRYTYGIFTSTDPEEHAIGTYGNICLEIDLTIFMLENGLEELNIDIEPDVREYIIRSALSNRLDVQIEFDVPSDMSHNTLIIGHTIPIKYIRVLN